MHATLMEGKQYACKAPPAQSISRTQKRESIMSSAKVLEQNNVKENADGGQAVGPHDE